MIKLTNDLVKNFVYVGLERKTSGCLRYLEYEVSKKLLKSLFNRKYEVGYLDIRYSTKEPKYSGAKFVLECYKTLGDEKFDKIQVDVDLELYADLLGKVVGKDY